MIEQEEGRLRRKVEVENSDRGSDASARSVYSSKTSAASPFATLAAFFRKRDKETIRGITVGWSERQQRIYVSIVWISDEISSRGS